MAAFKLLGDLLNGTGWVTALSEADIASLGTAESFLVGHKPSQAFVLDLKRMLPPSLYPCMLYCGY
jgi:hypothetical protein